MRLFATPMDIGLCVSQHSFRRCSHPALPTIIMSANSWSPYGKSSTRPAIRSVTYMTSPLLLQLADSKSYIGMIINEQPFFNF